MAADEHERVVVEQLDDLRAWLRAHHADRRGAWLILWKKGHGPAVSWAELVPELLAWGWVDTRGKRVDDDRTSLLVTPRTSGSGWSRINKEHVTRLVGSGRMQPSGQVVVDRAVADGSWSALDDVENLVEPPELSAALDAVPAAREHYAGFPRSAKRAILDWLHQAKRAETRERRVALIVAEAAQGRRANERP